MGQIHVLFNNAGIGAIVPAFSCDTPLEALQSSWTNILGVNFGGILNVAQAFAPYMVRQENSSVIINTGSKQGITCPPYVRH
jgi:NAD(P)-dependent dehydrogenase (short-subunit alcohol dehydrogenase family)